MDCSNKLEMYEGSDESGGEIGKYCNDNTPGLITSQTRWKPILLLTFLSISSSVYINWNNPGSNKFKATWKKVASKRHFLKLPFLRKMFFSCLLLLGEDGVKWSSG